MNQLDNKYYKFSDKSITIYTFFSGMFDNFFGNKSLTFTMIWFDKNLFGAYILTQHKY